MKTGLQFTIYSLRSIQNWLLSISEFPNFRICSLILLLSVVYCLSSSAQVSATLRADSTQIQIGDHLNIRLTVKSPNNLVVPFPAVTDTLGNLEMVSAAKIDTSAEGSNKILSQLYTVSAYDSGEFHAGPVKIYFKNSSGELDSVLSNDIPVTVNTLNVDTTKPFKAIKAPARCSLFMERVYSLHYWFCCFIDSHYCWLTSLEKIQQAKNSSN
jgi:hypothetical protein